MKTYQGRPREQMISAGLAGPQVVSQLPGSRRSAGCGPAAQTITGGAHWAWTLVGWKVISTERQCQKVLLFITDIFVNPNVTVT